MDDCFFVPQFPNESLCETEFDLHENELVGESRMNAFALRHVWIYIEKVVE